MINFLSGLQNVFISDLLKVSQQTMWQIVSKAATALSTFIILGIIARTYQEAGTGTFTLALTYLGFFYLATDLGLNAYFLPRLPQFKDDANNLFNLRLILSILLVVLANLGTFFLPFNSDEFRLFVLIGSFSIFFNSLLFSFNLIFQNQLKYELPLAASVVGAFLNVVVVAFLSLTHASLPLLAFGTLAATLVTSVISYGLVSGYYKFSLNFNQGPFLASTFTNAWPIMVTLGLNMVYFRIDTFILSSLYPMSVVGTYNLAYQIFQSLLVVPTFIMNSFYPILIEDQKTRTSIFARKIFFAGGVLLSVAIIGTILTWILSGFVINLITGSNFGGSDVSLQVLSLGFPAFFLTSLLMMVMIILGKYKELAAVYSIGLIFNLILNWVWIPQFSFIAASWVTVVCEYLILLSQLTIIAPILKSQISVDNQVES